jgi:hypothetical protein
MTTYCVSEHPTDRRSRVTLGETCTDGPWVKSFTFQAWPQAPAGVATDQYCVAKATRPYETYRLERNSLCNLTGGYARQFQFYMPADREKLYCRATRPNPTRHRIALRTVGCNVSGYSPSNMYW